MAFAQIGFLTALMESAATAVGAGIVLGGFLTGVVGLVAGWPRPKFDARVLVYGYFGGFAGSVAMFADITFRYLV
jgi:hypothetical protein